MSKTWKVEFFHVVGNQGVRCLAFSLLAFVAPSWRGKASSSPVFCCCGCIPGRIGRLGSPFTVHVGDVRVHDGGPLLPIVRLSLFKIVKTLAPIAVQVGVWMRLVCVSC